jgi:hypothetical protein
MLQNLIAHDDNLAAELEGDGGGAVLDEDLTAAEYVFLVDPWWNPAVEMQAIDRAHRIGQEPPVFAHRLIARDTVEETTEVEARPGGCDHQRRLIRNLSREVALS